MRRELIEIMVAYALIEAALWSEKAAQIAWSVAAGIWIVGVMFLRRPRIDTLGLGSQGLRSSLWIVPAASALAAVMLAAANAAGTLHGVPASPLAWQRALLYLPWTFAQQFLVQSFFFLRLEHVLGSGGRAVAGAAVLYSAAHVPNPVLLPATLLAGLFFCQAFRRYRNLYPLAIAHALLGLATLMSVPEHLHRHMRVGIAYLSYPG
ncbi:MAG: CPBP family glutamic-type intramembrane protease [Acidobacteria bacterium]|nr:CPBP family glutamic-type intramembrane protease [Acidobacteriota bacterium]